MSFLAKSAGTMASQVGLLGLNLVSGVVLARWLGPEDRGRYALLILVPQLLFVLGNVGVGAAATYYAGRARRPAAEILGQILALASLLGGGAALLYLLGLPFYRGFWSGSPPLLLLLLVLLTPFLFARNFLGRFLAGRQRIARMNWLNLLRTASLVAVLVPTLVLVGGGLWGAVAAFAASIVIPLVLGLVWSLEETEGQVRFTLRGLRPLLVYGLQAYLLVVANFLNYRFDLFLVKYYLSDADVGHYSVAVGLAERLWMLPNALSIVLFPTVTALAATQARQLAARSSRVSLAIMALATTALALAGPLLVRLLYGPEYLPAVPAVLAMLPGILLFPLFRILAVYAAGRGRPLWGAVASIIVLGVNVAANLLLIPRWGIVGAAASHSVSYALAGLGCALAFSRRAEIPLREVLLPTRSDFVDLRRRLAGLLRHSGDGETEG